MGEPSTGTGPTGSGSAFAPTPPEIAAPTLSLPKSGGAIRGIGEKFAANPATGTGSMSVPIATSPGRSGFGPQLSLELRLRARATARSALAGRWRCPRSPAGPTRASRGTTTPTCSCSPTRRTSSPRSPRRRRRATGNPSARVSPPHAPGYRDRPVPAPHRGAVRADRTLDPPRRRRHALAVGHAGQRRELVRPGRQLPRDATRRIRRGSFSWLLCRSEDGRGNAISYEYLEENGDGVDLAQAHERHRGSAERDGQPVHQADPVRQPGLPSRRSRPAGSRLDVRGRVRLRRARPGLADSRGDRAAAVPGRPVLLLPRGLRAPDLPAVPSGADVPPLPDRGRGGRRTASCARPTSATRRPVRPARSSPR